MTANIVVIVAEFPCLLYRKGAAYGIAGVVSGLKISAINGYGILDTLKASLEDKASLYLPSQLLLAKLVVKAML